MSESEISTISDTPSAPDNALNRTRFCVTRLHTRTEWITCGLGSSNLICLHSLVFFVGNEWSNYEFDLGKKEGVKEETKEMNKRECDI